MCAEGGLLWLFLCVCVQKVGGCGCYCVCACRRWAAVDATVRARVEGGWVPPRLCVVVSNMCVAFAVNVRVCVYVGRLLPLLTV